MTATECMRKPRWTKKQKAMFKKMAMKQEEWYRPLLVKTLEILIKKGLIFGYDNYGNLNSL